MKVGHRAALPLGEATPAEGEPDASPQEGYDPGGHTVAEVVAYVAEHPEEREGIRAAEEAGKARVTLLDALADPLPEG